MLIKNVNVVNDEFVYLTVDGQVEVKEVQADGTVAKVQSDEFSMTRKDLVRQLCNLSEDVALLAALKGTLHQRELVLLLIGAKVDVNRVYHMVGDVVDGHEFTAEGFTTELSNLTLSARAMRKLDEAFGF